MLNFNLLLRMLKIRLVAAAKDVEGEDLGPLYSGILGIGLPASSIIEQALDNDDQLNGATILENIYDIGGNLQSPVMHFMSLVLARPGDPRRPSLLGIGMHPPDIIVDPSKIIFSPVISDRNSASYWKLYGDKVSVFSGGIVKDVDINQPVVFDSGVPIILTTPAIADGIYNAIGVTADQQDGNCKEL